MVFLKSFKNNPSCSVLMKPNSGPVLEMVAVALAYEGAATVPGTPWRTHLAVLYMSSIACGSAGLWWGRSMLRRINIQVWKNSSKTWRYNWDNSRVEMRLFTSKYVEMVMNWRQNSDMSCRLHMPTCCLLPTRRSRSARINRKDDCLEKVGKKRVQASMMKGPKRWMYGQCVFDLSFIQLLKSLICSCRIDTAWLWPYQHYYCITQQKVARSWLTQMQCYPEHRFASSSAQQNKWLEELYPSLFESNKFLKGNFTL